MLYATLRWSAVTRAGAPAAVTVRLQELASCSEPWGRGLRWRIRTHGPGEYMAGWCNGSAGYVHLFTLAHDVTGDDRWLSIATGAAWHAWEGGGAVTSLCCGSAGQAYALLNLYRHDGDRAWLRRARELATRAASEPQDAAPDSRHDSLYEGRVGVALLAADIENPDLARMPFFEHEGWML